MRAAFCAVVASSVLWPVPAAAWDTNEWQFLDSIQRTSLDFFLNEHYGPYDLVSDNAHYTGGKATAWSSVAGIGFELTALCIGHYRGWLSGAEAYNRILHILRGFHGELSENPEVLKRENGWTYHWYYLDTGLPAWEPYGSPEGALSLLDHSLFIAGCIFVSEYFGGTEAGVLAHQLYEETTWSGRPNHDYDFGYSENLLAIIQSAEAPAHKKGHDAYVIWNSLVVPWPRMLQLYFWQYPHTWIDFRFRVDDNGFNHSDVARDSVLYQRQRAMELHTEDPSKYDMLGPNVWGWTAAISSTGYRQMAPWELLGWSVERASDSGSITPFALPPCMIYAPTETMAAMKHIFEEYYIKGWNPDAGERPIWSDTYGFLNCFNTGKPWKYNEDSSVTNWYATVNAAIDYGPNVLMLDNYKLGSVWRWFMQNPYIAAGMYTVGFGPNERVSVADFDEGSNAFGGGLDSWHNDDTPVTIEYVDVETLNEYVGGKAVRIEADNSNEGGWIDIQTHRDQRSHALLSFWVRGGTGQERIDIGLKDTLGVENKTDLLNHTGGVMPTNWTEVKIPLETFCMTGNLTNDVWLGRLRLVSFAFTNPEGGELFVDYLAFTPDTLAPVRPANSVGAAMAGPHARVRWDKAAAERDVVGYHVWRRFDATSGFDRVTATIIPRHVEVWEDTTLIVPPGQEVRYAIQAFDNSQPQNRSDFSSEKIVIGGKLDLDWNNGTNPNVFGGRNDGYWGGPGDEWFGFVYTNGPGGGLQWVRRSFVSSSDSGHFIDLAGGDAGDFALLSFHIRGAEGGEKIQVGLKDNGLNEFRMDPGYFMPGGVIETGWHRVIIPLNDFVGVDVTALDNLSFLHETGGEVELADIAFLPGQRPLLNDQTGFRECEDFDVQFGSDDVDFKPGASGGQVLGASWGMQEGSHAVYSNLVTEAHTNTWFHLWYAIDMQYHPEGRILELYVNDSLRAFLTCPPTGGWGDRVSDFDRVAVRIGPLEAGSQTVTLVAPDTGVPVNLDCLYIGDESPDSFGLDRDGDGLSDRQEAVWGTDPENPDTDGDGIPDGDEVQYGAWRQVSYPTLADSDGSGYTDYEEWIAGTNPLDPDSVFAVHDIYQDTNGCIVIEWPAVSGRIYRLFYTDVLSHRDVFEEIAGPHYIINGRTVRYRVEDPAEAPVFFTIDVRLDP